MKGRLSLVLVLALAAAGCADPSKPIATAPGNTEEVPDDVFFLHAGGFDSNSSMDRNDDGGEMIGGGWENDGEPCPHPQPRALANVVACYGNVFPSSEALASGHARGEPVQVIAWMAPFMGPAGAFALEATLQVDGVEVAHGASTMQAGPPSNTPGSFVASNCAAWEVDLTLQEAVGAGQVPTLSVMEDDTFAAPCTGGARDGSRLVFGLPGSPS